MVLLAITVSELSLFIWKDGVDYKGLAVDPDQEYIYFRGSAKPSSDCYILCTNLMEPRRASNLHITPKQTTERVINTWAGLLAIVIDTSIIKLSKHKQNISPIQKDVCDIACIQGRKTIS